MTTSTSYRSRTLLLAVLPAALAVSLTAPPALAQAAAPADDGAAALNGRIAVVRSESYPADERAGVYAMNPDGLLARSGGLWNGDDVNAPAWSPDGSRLAVSTRGDDDTLRQIWVQDDDYNRTRLTADPAIAAFNPSWSPDGTEIAFSGGPQDSLYAVATDGSGAQRVVADGICAGGSSWSRSGEIVFADCSTKDLYTVPASGDGAPVPLTQTAEREGSPDVSRDGSRVVYTRSGDNGDEVWLMNADGSDPRRLAQGAQARFSPDGTKVAYIAPTLQGGRLHLLDLAGGETAPVDSFIYPGQEEYGVAWQPVLRDTEPAVAIMSIQPDIEDVSQVALGSRYEVRYLCSDNVRLHSCDVTLDGEPVVPTGTLPHTEDDAAAGGRTVALDTSTPGRHVFRMVPGDGVNASSTVEFPYTVVDALAPDVDPPTIHSSTPPDGAVVPYGSRLTLDVHCADADPAVSCTTTLDGAPIGNSAVLDTSREGTHTLVTTARDGSGNVATRTATYTVVSSGDVAATVEDGGTVSTGTTATASTPVQTSIRVPAGISGTLTVDAQPVTGTAPSGFALFGQQLVIGGPAATAQAPYTMTFTVDASVLAGVAPSDVTVYRDGVALAGCTSTTAAEPDPCTVSRGPAPDGSGDALVTVRTSRFSTWTLGRPQYALTGPFQPVDTLPTVNLAKAGSAVPVRFRLGGDRGLDVLATGYPRVLGTHCATGGDEVEQTLPSTTAALAYDRASDTYTYTWKTAKADRGCKDLTLRFRDGSELRARFNLR